MEEVRPFHKGTPHRNKNVFFRALPLPRNNEYDNDGSDNCDYNFGTFDNFGVKNDQKVSHNMILMSRYMGQLHGGRGPKISGNAQKKSFFFCEVFPNNA